jgi:hypothetical protein
MKAAYLFTRHGMTPAYWPSSSLIVIIRGG